MSVKGGKGNGNGSGQEAFTGIRVFSQRQDGSETVRTAFLAVETIRVARCIEAVPAGMDELTVAADDSGNNEYLTMLGIPMDVDAADGEKVPYRQEYCRHEAEKPGCMLLLVHVHKDNINN